MIIFFILLSPKLTIFQTKYFTVLLFYFFLWFHPIRIGNPSLLVSVILLCISWHVSTQLPLFITQTIKTMTGLFSQMMPRILYGIFIYDFHYATLMPTFVCYSLLSMFILNSLWAFYYVLYHLFPDKVIWCSTYRLKMVF